MTLPKSAIPNSIAAPSLARCICVYVCARARLHVHACTLVLWEIGSQSLLPTHRSSCYRLSNYSNCQRLGGALGKSFMVWDLERDIRRGGGGLFSACLSRGGGDKQCVVATCD